MYTFLSIFCKYCKFCAKFGHSIHKQTKSTVTKYCIKSYAATERIYSIFESSMKNFLLFVIAIPLFAHLTAVSLNFCASFPSVFCFLIRIFDLIHFKFDFLRKHSLTKFFIDTNEEMNNPIQRMKHPLLLRRQKLIQMRLMIQVRRMMILTIHGIMLWKHLNMILFDQPKL